jgi:hypothetical protein
MEHHSEFGKTGVGGAQIEQPQKCPSARYEPPGLKEKDREGERTSVESTTNLGFWSADGELKVDRR